MSQAARAMIMFCHAAMNAIAQESHPVPQAALRVAWELARLLLQEAILVARQLVPLATTSASDDWARQAARLLHLLRQDAFAIIDLVYLPRDNAHQLATSLQRRALRLQIDLHHATKWVQYGPPLASILQRAVTPPHPGHQLMVWLLTADGLIIFWRLPQPGTVVQLDMSIPHRQAADGPAPWGAPHPPQAALVRHASLWHMLIPRLHGFDLEPMAPDDVWIWIRDHLGRVKAWKGPRAILIDSLLNTTGYGPAIAYLHLPVHSQGVPAYNFLPRAPWMPQAALLDLQRYAPEAFRHMWHTPPTHGFPSLLATLPSEASRPAYRARPTSFPVWERSGRVLRTLPTLQEPLAHPADELWYWPA